jgi:hypothetical protein
MGDHPILNVPTSDRLLIYETVGTGLKAIRDRRTEWTRVSSS